MDIWLYDVARGLRTRFTFDPAAESDAIWSPDGKTIIFDSNRRGQYDLYRKAANGSGAEELLYAAQLSKVPTSTSPDGRSLLYTAVADSETGSDLWILPDPLGAPGAAKPYPFKQTQCNEENGSFRRTATGSRTNRMNRAASKSTPCRFRVRAASGRFRPAGGVRPRWRADGKEIFYIAADQRLTAAGVTIKDGGIETGEVHPLFGPLLTGNGYQYDVSADGQRILAVTPRADASEALTIVQNWTAGLRK
jgi:Tol biopolymer transport system component